MENTDLKKLSDTSIEERIKEELTRSFESKRKRIFAKMFGAALGSVPWVGGFLSALAALKADESQFQNNQLYQQWLEEHKTKMQSLADALIEIVKRLDGFPEEINTRLESEEYLQIVRKSFRSWDNAETSEKKAFVRMLLTNSGASTIIPDDLVSLFLDWIDLYHETHFAVIKVIFKKPGATRFGIWKELNGKSVKENSLEADLFKLLIRDLSTGGVIRQHRQVDYYGNFVKKEPAKTVAGSKTLTSAFDDKDAYELTELGKEFVHYTMTEVVKRVAE